MSFFKPKFVLLVVASALLPALWTSGCSGDAFTGASAGGSASSGGSATDAGTGPIGTGAGTGVACGGPEDCDDKKACTIDLCNADGTCDASPKCSGAEKCCDGDCAQCCTDADCDDGISCTTNTCFSNQCMFVPDDTKCDVTQYCSVKDGCRARAACGILTNEAPDVCDDGSACTVDSCEGNLCQHDYCGSDPAANLCCEGIGCAACCNDSQCDDHKDPCKIGLCTGGKCGTVDRCPNGQECCPSADGLTATCGSCCSAAECDDNVGCTEDKCGGGQCSHTPTAAKCDAGYLCDPVKGCQKAPACMVGSDCRPGACQANPKCEGGACHFDGCSNGTKCCAGVAGATSSGCALCCGNAECTDNIACTKDVCGPNGCSHTPDSSLCQPGQVCDAQLGCVGCQKETDCDDGLPCTTDTCGTVTANTCFHSSTCTKPSYCTVNGCSQCVSDSDCQGGVVTANVIIPPGTCNWSTCDKGMCTPHSVPDCGDFQYCCPPYGCQLDCAIQTQ